MTPYMRERLETIAKEHNYGIRDEKRLDVLSDKFQAQVTQHGAMFCPCQNNKDKDTICPCKFIREHGACRCGLFVEKGYADGK